MEMDQDKKKPRINSFLKLITFLCLVHGMLCVTASYVLAFLNHTPVENLSMTIVTQIVAPLCVYTASNTIANIFEKNQLKISTPLSAIKEGLITPQMPMDTNYYSNSSDIDEINDVDDLDNFEFASSSGLGDDEII